MAELSALRKALMRLEEGGAKLKGSTLGDIASKGKSLAKDAYETVKAHPKASAIAGAGGAAAGYGAHALTHQEPDDDEEQERLGRMLDYIHGGG